MVRPMPPRALSALSRWMWAKTVRAPVGETCTMVEPVPCRLAESLKLLTRMSPATRWPALSWHDGHAVGVHVAVGWHGAGQGAHLGERGNVGDGRRPPRLGGPATTMSEVAKRPANRAERAHHRPNVQGPIRRSTGSSRSSARDGHGTLLCSRSDGTADAVEPCRSIYGGADDRIARRRSRAQAPGPRLPDVERAVVS